MSWSAYATGTKARVSEEIGRLLDACAKNYDGKEEQKDVLLAKSQALSAIAEMDESGNMNAWYPGGSWGVRVEASGSRCSSSMSISVKVERVVLHL